MSRNLDNAMDANAGEVTVLEKSEFGASDSWTWYATIWRGPDGSYSARLEQVMDASYSEGGLHDEELDDEEDVSRFEVRGLVDGAALCDFLNSSWLQAHDEILGAEDWAEIVGAVRALDHRLAQEIEEAVERDLEREPTPKELRIADWVSRARLTSSEPNGESGRWAHVARYARAARANKAIAFYVQQYFNSAGDLPRGAHRIVVKFSGTESDGDCAPPPWSGEGGFDEEVVFPDGAA